MSLRPFFEEEKDFFKHWFSRHPEELHTYGLATDMYQNDGNIIVEMHVPGMDNENLTIEVLDNNKLRVTGTNEHSEEKEKAQFYTKELRYGEFEENLRLPSDVIADEVSAEVKNGVLVITLPIKNEPGKASVKTIMVKNKK